MPVEEIIKFSLITSNLIVIQQIRETYPRSGVQIIARLIDIILSSVALM